MLLNLKTEIARNRTSQRKIAKFLGLGEKAMSEKINEKTDFTRSEMYKIKKTFFPNVEMEYLFESEKENIKCKKL